MRNSVEEFEARYQRDEDPWNFASSPYEQAKYDRTLAALGRCAAPSSEVRPDAGGARRRTYPFALDASAPPSASSPSAWRRAAGA